MNKHMKGYIKTTIKTLIFIGIMFSLAFGAMLGIREYSKYNLKNTIMDEYLISNNKINSLSSYGLSFKPTQFEMETEDGLYIVNSDNYFKGITNITSLYGENFEVRKDVIKELKKEKLANVKRGSLTYKGKGVYEAYDFDTKHFFTITTDKKTNEITIEYKDIE